MSIHNIEDPSEKSDKKVQRMDRSILNAFFKRYDLAIFNTLGLKTDVFLSMISTKDTL